MEIGGVFIYLGFSSLVSSKVRQISLPLSASLTTTPTSLPSSHLTTPLLLIHLIISPSRLIPF